MAYSANEARVEMLQEMAAAADELAVALACLSEAYEELDDDSADALEEAMFRPVQASYGRLKRTHAEFSARHRFPERRFEERSPGTHSGDPRVYIERALEAAEAADQAIADLQDSMRPVEVGDQELRAGLAETRAALAHVPLLSAVNSVNPVPTRSSVETRPHCSQTCGTRVPACPHNSVTRAGDAPAGAASETTAADWYW